MAMRSCFMSGAAAALCWLLTGAASACGNGSVLFEDKLASGFDESWGWSEDATRSLAPSGVSWTLQPNASWMTLNQTSLYEDFEVCADLAMTYPATSSGFIGLAFWGVDAKNNYTVDLFPAAGGIGIFRTQNGKVLKPVPYFKSDAVKTAPGAANALSIAVSGKHVAVSVNGVMVKEFNGIPPSDGGLVGIDLGTASSDSGQTTFTYSDFQVREPPAPEPDLSQSSKKKAS